MLRSVLYRRALNALYDERAKLVADEEAIQKEIHNSKDKAEKSDLIEQGKAMRRRQTEVKHTIANFVQRKNQAIRAETEK